MFAFLARWFRRRSATPMPASPAPTAAARPASAPLPVTAERPAAAPPAGEALVAALAARVREACGLLAHDFAGVSTAADAPALLDALREAPVDAVRQLPSAAREAVALCNDPRADFAQLARIVGADPGLAQALLRRANSAHYARAGQAPVVGIRDAIQRVGVAGLQAVLLEVTVQGLLCQPGPALAPIAEAVWDHSVATAPLARSIAPAFGASPDAAYALGLMHDVGKLVVLDQVSALRARRQAAPLLPPAFVTGALRALHEPLGALAVHRWGLGDAAALAVGGHHRAPPPPWDDALGETLHLAERVELAHRRGEALDLPTLWATGRLTGDAARAGRAIALTLPAPLPTAARAPRADEAALAVAAG